MEKTGISVLRAVRLKCLNCSAGSSKEVEQCPITDCALYPYRFGRNPNIKKREMTEEQREAMKVNLENARSKRKKNKKEERGLPE